MDEAGAWFCPFPPRSSLSEKSEGGSIGLSGGEGGAVARRAWKTLNMLAMCLTTLLATVVSPHELPVKSLKNSWRSASVSGVLGVGGGECRDRMKARALLNFFESRRERLVRLQCWNRWLSVGRELEEQQGHGALKWVS